MARLIALAALLGLLGGSGPLNHSTAGGPPDPIQVQDPRFGRLAARMDLRVTLHRPGEQDEARVWLSRSSLNALDLEEIRPEPSTRGTRPDGVVYVFDSPQAAEPTTVTFFVRPVRWGKLQGELGVPGQPALNVRPFIYP